MININMTNKAGVTLATAGKYCADNVKVTPSADILRKDEQAKTATPTTSAQDITPDAGKALSKVTVNPITAAIVGDLDADSFASSIVAAIEGKGVDVPSGAKLSALAALIEAIEAGGGSYATGSFTVASGSYTYYNIQHNLGQIPTFALIYAESATPVSGRRYRRGGGFICVDPSQSIPDGMFWTNIMLTSSASAFSLVGNSNNGEFGLLQSSMSGYNCHFTGLTENELRWYGSYSYDIYLLPGVEYKYIIGVF